MSAADPDRRDVARLVRQRAELGGDALFFDELTRSEVLALARQRPASAAPSSPRASMRLGRSGSWSFTVVHGPYHIN